MLIHDLNCYSCEYAYSKKNYRLTPVMSFSEFFIFFKQKKYTNTSYNKSEPLSYSNSLIKYKKSQNNKDSSAHNPVTHKILRGREILENHYPDTNINKV